MSPELLAANGKTRSNVHIHRTPSREEEKVGNSPAVSCRAAAAVA